MMFQINKIEEKKTNYSNLVDREEKLFLGEIEIKGRNIYIDAEKIININEFEFNVVHDEIILKIKTEEDKEETASSEACYVKTVFIIKLNDIELAKTFFDLTIIKENLFF